MNKWLQGRCKRALPPGGQKMHFNKMPGYQKYARNSTCTCMADHLCSRQIISSCSTLTAPAKPIPALCVIPSSYKSMTVTCTTLRLAQMLGWTTYVDCDHLTNRLSKVHRKLEASGETRAFEPYL